MKAKESQETHRLRVVLPSTVWSGQPSGAPSAASGSAGQSELSDSLSVALSPMGRGVLLGTLLSVAGWMAWRTLSPATAQRAVGSTAPWVAVSAKQPEAFSEDQAFDRFLVAFRAGPAARSKSAAVPEKAVAEAGRDAVKPSGKQEPKPLQHFFASLPEQLGKMRAMLQTVRRETDESAQRRLLGELGIHLHALTEAAALPELLPIWQVVSATEALVAQLTKPNREITRNTLRTVASGLDLLVELCGRRPKPDLWSNPPIRILAVDDDLLSRHAVALALKKAFNQPDLAANSEAAFAQASMIAYDVIFLDVLMPGMDGFELCSKIRKTSVNQLTPIVFITGQSDFDARAKSSLSGGNDFITKPFLTFEITVKALVLAIHCRLAKQATPSLASPVPCPA